MQLMRPVAALVLGLFAAAAQTPSKPATGRPTAYPLVSLKVEGNLHLTEEKILDIAGIRLGQTVGKADFDAAQQRLLETGLFETVAYRYAPSADGKGYNAVFEVRPIGQLFPYRFEALDADPAALRAEVQTAEPLFKDKIPATETVLKKISDALTVYMEQQGKPGLQVIGRLDHDEKGQLEVVFQPGVLPTVAEVRFRGNKILSEQALQLAVAGTAIGSRFTEERFQQILDATIRPLYEAEGHLRVAFKNFQTAPAPGVRGLSVTVDVDEGPKYTLSRVALGGELKEDPGLLKAGNFRLNETVNMKEVETGVANMELALKQKGYLKIDSEVERTMDDEKQTVSLLVKMDPGPQYKMNNLTIQGLDIQSEPVIRKLWTLKEGEVFDYTYPDYFLDQIRERAIFDNLGRTRAKVDPDPGTLRVDVTLIFEGDKPEPEKKRPF
jgi:outer membrane protein insertion porin family